MFDLRSQISDLGLFTVRYSATLRAGLRPETLSTRLERKGKVEREKGEDRRTGNQNNRREMIRTTGNREAKSV